MSRTAEPVAPNAATRTRTVDIAAMVEIQDRPCLIIDRDFRIIAVNRAYEQAYRVDRAQMIGRTCHQVTHHNNQPCYVHGEDCPYHRLYKQGEAACTCLHVHHDVRGEVYRVKVKAFAIEDSSGEVYVGEVLEKLAGDGGEDEQKIQMVGESRVFLRTLEQLKLAAMSHAPVLLEGETGTGKDLAAQFIHQNSERAKQRLLTLDCTVLTESLFEAEVFGHEKGAYTGSVGAREGLLEVVDGGTLFIDEIGEMSPQLQAKFLRVLESGEFRRVGGRTTLHTNARIICATNRDLGRDVDANHFREDLYYRIACLHIAIPSLRDRLQDVPVIARTLLAQMCRKGSHDHVLTDEALEELGRYDYPGNIRELRNILMSSCAARGPAMEIRGEDVAAVIARLKENRSRRPAPPAGAAGSVEDTGPVSCPAGGVALPPLHHVEARYLAELLEAHQGNRRRIAEALGVSERTVYRKLKRYGLS